MKNINQTRKSSDCIHILNDAIHCTSEIPDMTILKSLLGEQYDNFIALCHYVTENNLNSDNIQYTESDTMCNFEFPLEKNEDGSKFRMEFPLIKEDER